jgi:cytoskeletal protein RodZ
VLRQERLRQDLSLNDIASQTKISERYLEAIEQENFESLPGVLFARNFVRQYASALKVDPEPMLAELPKVDIANAPLPDPPARVKRSKWDPRWTSPLASAAWSVLALGAAFIAWVHFNHPAWSLPYLGQTVSASAAVEPIQETTPIPAPPVEKTSVPDPEGAASEPGKTAQATATESPARPIQIVVTAHESAWVEVVADGKTTFSGTLQPNDSRAIAADAQVKLVTGNAGGIGISLNGRALDPIGPSGQARTVKLTAEGLQFVQTPPPAPDPL